MFLKIAGIAHSFSNGSRPFPVLDSIDLKIDHGEFICVLGPSGCGKTTLLNIIAGLIACDSGEIYLDDKRVGSARGQAAYMQQKDLLLALAAGARQRASSHGDPRRRKPRSGARGARALSTFRAGRP
jgi:ABC-type nitrate/sulfonate/bicarbonate transport system ATPase subunit